MSIPESRLFIDSGLRQLPHHIGGTIVSSSRLVTSKPIWWRLEHCLLETFLASEACRMMVSTDGVVVATGAQWRFRCASITESTFRRPGTRGMRNTQQTSTEIGSRIAWARRLVPGCPLVTTLDRFSWLDFTMFAGQFWLAVFMRAVPWFRRRQFLESSSRRFSGSQ